MAKDPYVEKIHGHIEAAIVTAEAYHEKLKAMLAENLKEPPAQDPTVAKLQVQDKRHLERQIVWAEEFIALVQDQVLEKLIDLANRGYWLERSRQGFRFN